MGFEGGEEGGEEAEGEHEFFALCRELAVAWLSVDVSLGVVEGKEGGEYIRRRRARPSQT